MKEKLAPIWVSVSYACRHLIQGLSYEDASALMHEAGIVHDLRGRHMVRVADIPTIGTPLSPASSRPSPTTTSPTKTEGRRVMRRAS